MTKKYALSLALLGSLGLSYPVLAGTVIGENDFQKVYTKHLKKNREIREVAHEFKNARTSDEYYSALKSVADKSDKLGGSLTVVQDGKVLASSGETLKAGQDVFSHPVYSRALEKIRSNPSNNGNNIEVSQAEDENGTKWTTSAMIFPTRHGTTAVISKELA